jgi:5-methylcytosine-specific restriction endonuclease McrA
MAKATCSIEGCDNATVGRGWCHKHYERWRRHGDPLYVKPASVPRSCAIEECPHVATRKGWCDAHYRRWMKTGDTQASKPIKGAMPPHLAWCPRCAEMLPRERFQTNSGRPNGLNSYCLACIKQLYATRYRASTYEQQRRWRMANPERVAAGLRRYAQANPDKIRAKAVRLKRAKPEQYLAYARAGDHNRRAREQAAPGTATTKQIAARWAYFGGRCWMCGAVATDIDHVKPLARGGSNWPANLRPACSGCNHRKRARWPYPLEVARGCATVDGQSA